MNSEVHRLSDGWEVIYLIGEQLCEWRSANSARDKVLAITSIQGQPSSCHYLNFGLADYMPPIKTT